MNAGVPEEYAVSCPIIEEDYANVTAEMLQRVRAILWRVVGYSKIGKRFTNVLPLQNPSIFHGGGGYLFLYKSIYIRAAGMGRLF